MITIAALQPIGWKLSLHQGFSNAPDEILHAFRLYLNSRRKDAWALIRQYADTIHVTPQSNPKACRTAGKEYDLAQLQAQVEKEFFEGKNLARISWRKHRSQRTPRQRRSLRFGVYDTVENLIYVNELLDQRAVSQRFIEFIIYHESLHAVLPAVQQGTRTVYHHREFRRREKEFPEFDQMQRQATKYLKSLKTIR